jgi:hypothetical protein
MYTVPFHDLSREITRREARLICFLSIKTLICCMPKHCTIMTGEEIVYW